jgi:pSer/pThr/pTyr-binding forkhead associated (FHA) protein
MLQLRFVGTEKPPIWLVEERYIIGSGAGCHITLSEPSIKSQHAELSVMGEQVSVRPVTDGAVVAVNGSIILVATELTHGAALHVGECPLTIVDPKRERPVIDVTRSAASFAWALQSKSTALADKLFLIEKDTIVGRARECDLSLVVAHLSRRHARLFFDNGALWVEDLGSANGTYLNGRRVERARVRGGDELAFDTLVFTVRGEPAETMGMELDKTSLRPAVMALPPHSASTKQSGAANRSLSGQSPEPRKAVTADAPTPSPEHSGPDHSGLLWGGIAVAVLLTGAAILYFTA